MCCGERLFDWDTSIAKAEDSNVKLYFTATKYWLEAIGLTTDHGITHLPNFGLFRWKAELLHSLSDFNLSQSFWFVTFRQKGQERKEGQKVVRCSRHDYQQRRLLPRPHRAEDDQEH